MLFGCRWEAAEKAKISPRDVRASARGNYSVKVKYRFVYQYFSRDPGTRVSIHDLD